MEECIRNVECWFDCIEDQSDPEIRDLIALREWNIGRRFLTQGNPADARRMFQRAREQSPKGYHRYFSADYRLVLRLVGPRMAEYIAKVLGRRRFV